MSTGSSPPAGDRSRGAVAVRREPDTAHRRREAEQLRRRRHLERQLHDGASLRLSTLALRLGLLRQAPRDDASLQAGIDELQDELHAVLDELRDVAAKIYPPLLDQAGLGAALRELAETVDIEVVVVAPTDRFDPVTEGTAYFAVLECLSPPHPAWPMAVVARREDDELMLAIAGTDDRHLAFLTDQVEPLGGTVHITQGKPQEGATITVRIPCG